MFRRLQLSSAKLFELWNEREYNEQEMIKYFGRPPYEFLRQMDNNVKFARNFGSYGETIKDARRKLEKLPGFARGVLKEEDIGKYIDRKCREYIGGFDPDEYHVRLPEAPSTQRSEVPFPEPGDRIDMWRRGIKKSIKVVAIGGVRKATAALRVERL